MEEKKKTEEDVQKFKDSVKGIMNVDEVQHILNSNSVEFDYKNIKYKVSKPTFEQKQITNKKRIGKYLELLQDEKQLLEKDLIVLYKKRGIDIKEMDNKYNALEKEKNDLLFKLGEGIKEKKPETELDVFRKEIEKIQSIQEDILIKKTMYMDSSIETQITVFSYTFLSCLVTEKLVDNKWIKAWKDYKEFTQEEEKLVNIIVWYVSLLFKSDLEE